MKKLTNNHGLTLTELVAASIITVFMMIGIASMDISLRNIFEGISSSTAVATRASVLMHHISRHVLEAAGTSQTGGPGIGVAADGTTHLWIRKDDNSTPSNYSDDQWYVYQHNYPASNELSYCETTGPTADCATIQQTFTNINLFEPALANDQANCKFSVSVKLTAIYDAALAPDPVTNPECTLTSIFSIPDTGNTIP